MPSDIEDPSQTRQQHNSSKRKAVLHRSLARLLAVQAMYEMEIAGGDITHIIKDYITHRIYNSSKHDSGLDFQSVDKKYFKNLMEGCYERVPDIDESIEKVLKNRKISQIEAILLIILRLGVYEGRYLKRAGKVIVIDEYVELAKSFFDREEPALVNAILDKVIES